MLQQMIYQFVNVRLVDVVVVVQDQDKGFFEVVEIVAQTSCNYRQWRKSIVFQQVQCLNTGLGKHGLHGRHDVTEKHTGITVRPVKRQPDVWTITGLEPVTDERAFSVPCWRRHQCQRVIGTLFKQGIQSFAVHKIPSDRRSMQLGADNRK